jgi:hypothetical protein
MAESYAINVWNVKLETLQECLKGKRNALKTAVLTRAAITVMDEAMAQDEYDAASRAGQLAADLARQAKDKMLISFCC